MPRNSQKSLKDGSRRLFERRLPVSLLSGVIVGLLIWGVIAEGYRTDPFEPSGALASVFEWEPDAAYSQIPFVPAGSSLVLVPRGLCAEAADCGGIHIGRDSRLAFQDEAAVSHIADHLHVVPSSGQLFALTSDGNLFTLSTEASRAWRRVTFPVATQQPGGPPIFAMSVGIEDEIANTQNPVAFSPDAQYVGIVNRRGETEMWTTSGQRL